MKKNLCLIALFIFISFAFIGCEKEYSCEACDAIIEPLPLPVGDSILYYQFTLNNKNYQAIAFQNNFIAATGIRWNTLDHRDSGVVISGTILPPNTTNFPLAPFTFTVERGIIKEYSTISLNNFRSSFSPGVYNYASLKEITPPYTPVQQNGVAILWADEAGTIWRSDNENGNQSGSSFNIIKREDIMYSWGLGPVRMRITAEFNCKLYDGQGNHKQLTNGRIAYYFAKDF